MDRAYLDFARLHRIHRSGAFFVTRAKKNFRFRRRYSHPIRKREGMRFDQTIAQLYKCRWSVELFFKWIKQHLRIKAFYGTSENAVKTQIWIAFRQAMKENLRRSGLQLRFGGHQVLFGFQDYLEDSGSHFVSGQHIFRPNSGFPGLVNAPAMRTCRAVESYAIVPA